MLNSENRGCRPSDTKTFRASPSHVRWGAPSGSQRDVGARAKCEQWAKKESLLACFFFLPSHDRDILARQLPQLHIPPSRFTQRAFGLSFPTAATHDHAYISITSGFFFLPYIASLPPSPPPPLLTHAVSLASLPVVPTISDRRSVTPW